ncbi:MAG: hypothetical protein ACFCVK_14640 [Acidimicrobiales bacterium]
MGNIPPIISMCRITPDAPEINGWLGKEEIDEGDMMFCARPSPLQELCTRAGEPWRHVGLVGRDSNGLVIAEVAGARFGSRPIDDVLAANEAVAIGRVATGDRPAARRAASWCLAKAGEQQHYAWDDVVLSGFIAATRLYALPKERDVLERAIAEAILIAAQRTGPPGIDSMTCSSFIANAMRNVGLPVQVDLFEPRSAESRPTLLDLVRSRPRPVRAGGGSHITETQLRFLVRSLVRGVIAGCFDVRNAGAIERRERIDHIRWITPGDLWRSKTLVERFNVTR